MLHATRYKLHVQEGQSLIELVIGIALGIMFIAGAVGIVVLTLRIGSQNKLSQTANELTHELANQIPTLADANWHGLFDASPHGTSTPYHLVQSGGFFEVASGAEAATVGGYTYTRSFTVSDVYRDNDSVIIVDGSGTLDPSTLKVAITTAWIQNGEAANVQYEHYVSRNRSRVFNQTDWTSGSGDNGPNTSPTAGFSTQTNINYASIAGAIYIDSFATTEASTTNNIDATNRWAWNDVIGWIDFNITGTVTVTSSSINGYASSAVGYIAMDCATAPTPDCTYSYGVSNDGTGILSGFAWNDAVGWVKFKSTSGPSYGVTIASSTGDFSGFAWNDVVGWFSFNCADISACGTSNFKTQTLWSNTVSIGTLTSSILDTQISGGAGLNTIMWQGTKPTGTAVKFQIAASNSSSGPWEYLGPDGTSSTYYQPAGPDVQTKLTKSVHDNLRYVRYRVTLESNIEKTYSPLVSNVVIGWSP